MSSEVIICDSFLSQKLISRIEYQINSLAIKDYDNIKIFFPWLKDDILKIMLLNMLRKLKVSIFLNYQKQGVLS